MLLLQKFDDATMKILQLGFKREALSIMKEHAGILHKMAAVALEKEIRHTYYLQVGIYLLPLSTVFVGVGAMY